MSVPVRAKQSGDLGETELKVEGGNVPTQTTREPLTAGTEGEQFGVERYELTPELENGAPDLQAGSHPFQLTTTVELNQTLEATAQSSDISPGVPAQLRNVATVLPAGLVANTFAIPPLHRSRSSRPSARGRATSAPRTRAIGVVESDLQRTEVLHPYDTEAVPGLQPRPPNLESPHRFGIEFDNVSVTFDTSIRTGDGYAARWHVSNASAGRGVPGDCPYDLGACPATRATGQRAWMGMPRRRAFRRRP